MSAIPQACGLIYVATPYTDYAGGRDLAFRLAALYAGLLLRAGHVVFSPIAHSHPIAREARIDETDHEFWIAADAPFMAAAETLVVVTMPGWRESRGVALEIAAFEAAGKPVVYASPEELIGLGHGSAQEPAVAAGEAA